MSSFDRCIGRRGLVRSSGESLTQMQWPTWACPQGWRVPYTNAVADVDSSAGLASPLHKCSGRRNLAPYGSVQCKKNSPLQVGL